MLATTMNIKIINSRANYTIMEPLEEIGLYNSQDFKKKMLLLIDNSNSNIVVDLKNMSYADSTLIGCLIFGMKKLRALDKDLRLINVDPGVMRIFQTANIDKHFQIIDRLEDLM